MAHAECVVNVCIQDRPRKTHRVYTLDTELSVHGPKIFRWIAIEKASYAGSVFMMKGLTPVLLESIYIELTGP
jgi:hypothetical protein